MHSGKDLARESSMSGPPDAASDVTAPSEHRSRRRPSRLRAAIRLFRLSFESALLVSVMVLGRLPLLAAPTRVKRRWRAFMYRAWARRMARNFGVRGTYEGELPRGRFMLASNHLSYVDIPLLAQWFDGVFIAKAEIESWPFVGPLARSVGTIFVKRDSRRDAVRVSNDISAVLAEERGVVVFPEGTATDGATLLPFKSALLDVAADENVPVYSAAIRYDTGEEEFPASRFVCWAGDEPFLRHVWNLLQLGTIRATVHFGPARVSSDRKALAQQLWEDVAGELRIQNSEFKIQNGGSTSEPSF